VPTDAEPLHVDLELDGYPIGIASAASTRDDHGLDPIGEGQRAAVILWTDDTAAAYAAVLETGGPALAALHEWLGRLLFAWTADPDGNPIQIVQSPSVDAASAYPSSGRGDDWSRTPRAAGRR